MWSQGFWIALLAISSSEVRAKSPDLNQSEKIVIGQRIARVRDAVRNLRIEAGDTVFIVRTVTVPRNKLRGRALDYEGIVGAIEGSKSIFVDERIDDIRFEPTSRSKITVHLRYAVGVKPGAKRGGKIKFRLSLVKRKGMGEVALSVDGQHRVRVRRPIANRVDVAADFRAYRIYQNLAATRAAQLKTLGIRLSLSKDARLPPLLKAKPALIKAVNQFDQWKRRMWIAHGHLKTLTKHPQPEIADLADKYLRALNQPDDKIGHLPNIPLRADASELTEAEVKPIPSPSGSAANEDANSTSEVSLSKESSDIVQPLGNDSRPSYRTKRPTRMAPNRKSAASVSGVEPIKPSGEEPPSATAKAQLDKEEDEYLRGKRAIPSHPRFLMLSDPNVSFGGAIRFSYRTVSTTESARVPTLFAESQLALTSDLGVLLTVPMAYIDVDLPRTETVTTIGNPSVAAKYRFHLPNIGGDYPNITLKARWAIPFSHGPTVPPTRLTAEEFALAAHFVDASAFLFERHGVGGGLSSSWQLGPIHLGGEFLYEYLIPIEDSLSQSRFSVLSYGGGIGYRPFGPIIGAYIEAQGAMLIIGPRRNEVTTYAGIRSQLFDVFEFAAWGAATVAPNARPTNLSVGGELRFVYDVDSVILFKGAARKFGETDWAE